ncbi:GFA family protein [Stigmatella aurantiaca]|uniref:Glutathione-dependent formaldehyde-activating, GFA n=1 Tax=Stigmatella aurantiaca (strain DW4/3-1) TaxID=378806 RepID=Q08MJ8_STIAD|nr:GFA family protein [Stigmatella aurantiaca]ADO68838.1 Glutathione-dependent formaldehyde-activating, GFA family protein [Stigmatella aurantiaca DW4/3-1]EAU61706.1 glutathione-dependent formaldehyde-activating, GFA [Stigmatella aurantiaca DW4/3-1]
MTIRVAECRCGELTARCEGEPVRVSVCHCFSCQRRTGSAFAAQARFPANRVTISGQTRTYVRQADSGNHATYQFCPNCGSTIAYQLEAVPDMIAVPLGAFADPTFPPPKVSIYEARKHPWTVVLGDAVEHLD